MKKLGEVGLSLLELLISISIGSILLVSVLSVSLNGIRLATKSGFEQDILVDGMLLVDYFSREIPSAGGYGIPANGAILVENNCAARGPTLPNCTGSDRVTTIRPREHSNCRVTAKDGSWWKLENSAGCCMAGLDLMERQVVLLKGASYGQRHVRLADEENCRIQIQPGPLAMNDNVVDSGSAPYDWTGSSLLRVEMNTYYLNSQNRELMKLAYRDKNPSPNHAVQLTLADRVFDFQVSLGYDFDPADGVVEDEGNSTDEYLFNSRSSVERFGVGHFRDATAASLRMVGMSVVLGSPVAEPQQVGVARILDGPERREPRWRLVPSEAKFALRTLYLFQ